MTLSSCSTFLSSLIRVVHEAHGHPYLDRIGTIYLMRLSHGDQFISNAGSAWRRLFVLALMPWLHKYRHNPSELEPPEAYMSAAGT